MNTDGSRLLDAKSTANLIPPSGEVSTPKNHKSGILFSAYPCASVLIRGFQTHGLEMRPIKVGRLFLMSLLIFCVDNRSEVMQL